MVVETKISNKLAKNLEWGKKGDNQKRILKR